MGKCSVVLSVFSLIRNTPLEETSFWTPVHVGTLDSTQLLTGEEGRKNPFQNGNESSAPTEYLKDHGESETNQFALCNKLKMWTSSLSPH